MMRSFRPGPRCVVRVVLQKLALYSHSVAVQHGMEASCRSPLKVAGDSKRLADSQHASKDLVEEEKVVNMRNNMPVRKLLPRVSRGRVHPERRQYPQREREQHPPHRSDMYHVIIVSQLNSIFSHVITFI